MDMSRSAFLKFAGCCALAPVLPAASADAATFPSRPIKIVVGFGPGGIGDITARAVAQKMSESMNNPVYIENAPGAGGITAAGSVARAVADGHTMLLVSGQNAVSPYLFKSLPYEPNAFAMVSTVGVFDFVFVVAKDSPLRTIADLLATARKDPRRVNIGTISTGSIQNLSALLFISIADLKVPVIPFRATGDVVTALMGGEIQAGVETLPAVIGQIRAGTLRALAVGAKQRVSFLPDVPTVMESGLPGYSTFSWNGFAVPAKTPPDIVRKLNQEVGKAVASPNVRQRFHELGVTPHPSTPAEMQQIWDDDATRWRAVIVSAKIGQQ